MRLLIPITAQYSVYSQKNVALTDNALRIVAARDNGPDECNLAAHYAAG
jgi:hypothetical protein